MLDDGSEESMLNVKHLAEDLAFRKLAKVFLFIAVKVCDSPFPCCGDHPASLQINKYLLFLPFPKITHACL